MLIKIIYIYIFIDHIYFNFNVANSNLPKAINDKNSVMNAKNIISGSIIIELYSNLY